MFFFVYTFEGFIQASQRRERIQNGCFSDGESAVQPKHYSAL